MNVVMYALFTCIIVCLLLIWFISTYNLFQLYIIRMNEAVVNIDSTLRKRFDLLNKSIGIIRANADVEGEVLELIVKLRSRKLDNFTLDRQLYEAINEFQLYKEKFPNLKECEGYMKIEISLHESEAEIVAFRKYYNDIITEYNKMARTFPSIIVAKCCKYKVRPYFDGEDSEEKSDLKL